MPGVRRDPRRASGTSFTLTAKADRITTPDGNSIYFWGFAADGGRPQYPGPTLKIIGGATASSRSPCVNQLPAQFNQRVSLALAGQSGVTATCGGPRAAASRVRSRSRRGTGESVTYTFTASRPGTFLYNSASRPDLQVEMGLAGALIVYPATPGQAYDDAAPPSQSGNPAGSQYEQEYLFFLSEMDSEIHDLVEQQGVQAVDDSGRLGLLLPELLVHQRAQRARHDGRGGRVAPAHAALRRA